MRMIEQGPCPGVEHGQNRQPPADITPVPRELLQGGGGAAQEQSVENFLMGPTDRVQLLGDGQCQQVIVAGQEAGALGFQPAFDLFSVTLGTMPVAAGVIAVKLMSAAIALVKLAAAGRRAATHQILQELLLTGQKGVRPRVIRSVAAKDIRHLDHATRRLKAPA